jgi:hypothetical protein
MCVLRSCSSRQRRIRHGGRDGRGGVGTRSGYRGRR